MDEPAAAATREMGAGRARPPRLPHQSRNPMRMTEKQEFGAGKPGGGPAGIFIHNHSMPPECKHTRSYDLTWVHDLRLRAESEHASGPDSRHEAIMRVRHPRRRRFRRRGMPTHARHTRHKRPHRRTRRTRRRAQRRRASKRHERRHEAAAQDWWRAALEERMARARGADGATDTRAMPASRFIVLITAAMSTRTDAARPHSERISHGAKQKQASEPARGSPESESSVPRTPGPTRTQNSFLSAEQREALVMLFVPIHMTILLWLTDAISPADAATYTWALTHAAWNAIIHALIGNTPAWHVTNDGQVIASHSSPSAATTADTAETPAPTHARQDTKRMQQRIEYEHARMHCP